MNTSELLKKVRKIEIKAIGLSREVFAGQYHSAFKGRGMAFSEVREYQYGDDIRDIDWNVTGRFTYVAVVRTKIKEIISLTKGEKIKGIRTVVEEVR